MPRQRIEITYRRLDGTIRMVGLDTDVDENFSKAGLTDMGTFFVRCIASSSDEILHSRIIDIPDLPAEIESE